ncbi:Double zinc ribbon [uncultured archaeon]|nr:Double zinc ribbon [uncultured archaeon]
MGILDNILGNVKSDLEGRATEKITGRINKTIEGQNDGGQRRCPKCKKPIEEGLKFCPECGAKLVASCRKCQMDFPLGTKFCTQCGKPIK